MSWALQIPTTTLSDSSARHVLLCLANYAGTDGRGAFPSAGTLSDDTGLSERTVRAKLELLRESGLIVQGNQALAAVYIERHDRRPVVYDLPLKRGANPAPRSERGADNRTGCNPQQSGVQISAERGAKSAPNTSLNHQLTEEQQQREISDGVAEQDRQALDAQDDRQRFAMFASWQPAAKPLADQLTIAGLPTASVTDDLLSGFKGFYVARQSTVYNAAGWCFQLVKWIKNQRTKAAGTSSAASTDDFDDDSTEWMPGVSK
jgi:hypothetical protein